MYFTTTLIVIFQNLPVAGTTPPFRSHLDIDPDAVATKIRPSQGYVQVCEC